MDLGQQNFGMCAATSLLGWWRDAGVDVSVGEAPHDWLEGINVAKSAKDNPVKPILDQLPQTLEHLIQHLMTSDIAEAGPAARRVRPAGDATSTLMILTDFPDQADVASGNLLGDPVFSKMLEAIGKSRSSVYIASLCPGRPVTGRLSDENVAALAVLAKQHIALIGPKQLWLVGSAASRAILGVDDAAAKGKLHSVNHIGIIMEAIATAHPRMFDGSKSRKAAAWAEMQRLISRDEA